jgi:hypothetical protein
VIRYRIRISITQQELDTNGYQTKAISKALPASSSVDAKGKNTEGEDILISFQRKLRGKVIYGYSNNETWSELYILDTSWIVKPYNPLRL